MEKKRVWKEKRGSSFLGSCKVRFLYLEFLLDLCGFFSCGFVCFVSEEVKFGILVVF